MNAADDAAMKRVYRRVCGSILTDLERLKFGCDDGVLKQRVYMEEGCASRNIYTLYICAHDVCGFQGAHKAPRLHGQCCASRLLLLRRSENQGRKIRPAAPRFGRCTPWLDP